MKRRKIVIDTDIGDDIDDAYALVFAMALAELEVAAVVTTYRNAVMRTQIAEALIADYGREIPVFAGEDDPVKEPYHNFRHEVFSGGKPMISQYERDMSVYPVRKEGVRALVGMLREHPHELTVICIGPLTDMAKLLREYPAEAALIGELFVMGGNFEEERPEWNIKCDPEAADIVFSSGLPIKLIGWEITSQTAFDERLWEFFRSLGGKSRRLLRMSETWLRCNDYRNLPIMHDALTIGCAAKPFCSFVPVRVRVGMDGKERGITYAVPDEKSNLQIAVSVDLIEFFDCLKQSFLTANAEIYEKGEIG